MLLTLWDAKLRLMRVLLVAITVFYSSLVMYSVILRYGFNETIIGIEELATYSAIWGYFLGAAYGSYERSHISATLVPVIFSNETARGSVEAFATFLTLIISGILTWHVAVYFGWSLESRPRSLELRTDLVWFHAAVLFGFVMMTLYTALELADRILALCGREPLAISPSRKRTRETA